MLVEKKELQIFHRVKLLACTVEGAELRDGAIKMVNSSSTFPEASLQLILDWAQEHGRVRPFRKDQRILVQQNLLYIVLEGFVRLVTDSQASAISLLARHRTSREVCLSFAGRGQPFEIDARLPFRLHAYAHVEQTVVVWIYWDELNHWPYLNQEVLNIFRSQNQFKLSWSRVLVLPATCDRRLLRCLTLLVEEYGYLGQEVDSDDPYMCLPFTLTHAQLASLIGSTHVTVTRSMSKLRRRKLLFERDNLICLPVVKNLDV